MSNRTSKSGRNRFSRIVRLTAAAGLCLTLASGAGVAHADERRPPSPRETRDWEEVCDWYSCWLYALDCVAWGGSYEYVEDSSGNSGIICNED